MLKQVYGSYLETKYEWIKSRADNRRALLQYIFLTFEQ